MSRPNRRIRARSHLFMEHTEEPMTTRADYDPSWSILNDVTERARRYLGSVSDRRVAPTREAVAGLAALDVPLQDQPTPPEEAAPDVPPRLRAPPPPSPPPPAPPRSLRKKSSPSSIALPNRRHSPSPGRGSS